MVPRNSTSYCFNVVTETAVKQRKPQSSQSTAVVEAMKAQAQDVNMPGITRARPEQAGHLKKIKNYLCSYLHVRTYERTNERRSLSFIFTNPPKENKKNERTNERTNELLV